MKVALIGATGFVGKAILRELVERGHHVTAIARHVSNVEHHKNVVAKQVDVLNPDLVAAAAKGQDVVISAYNAGWTNPKIYDEFLAGSASIQAGVKKANVKRYLVIGGAGSLYVAEGIQAVDTPEFPAQWKPGALAARDYLNSLKNEKELEWTFLSPAIEMNPHTSGERKGHYRTGLENPVFNSDGRSIISVEDVAVAVVDEIEKPAHVRQRFTVGY